MSIIAVSRVHFKCTLKQMLTPLAKVIKAQFEVLNFGPLSKRGMKICYVRLSKELNPQDIIEDIKNKTKYDAFIPKTVPKIPARGLRPKPNRFSLYMTKDSPDKVLEITHSEILTELQTKYTGLFNLSKKTGHKLLDNIAETILERLKTITETSPENVETGYKLSKSYRKLHPHFGDFQLILSTLHRLQDAAGAARAQILEHELSAVTTQPYVIDNVPYNLVQQACNKYTERIVKKVTEHIKNLKTDMTETDTEEDIARKKVREEMKKISQYLPLMIKQVISNHFVPQKPEYQRIRMYGEPFMPTKEQMTPFLRRYHAARMQRSDSMYNVLRMDVPLAHYASLLAMDGSVIGGAKLVIRSADNPLYMPQSLAAAPKGVLGEDHMDRAVASEVDQEMGVDEDWTEDMVV